MKPFGIFPLIAAVMTLFTGHELKAAEAPVKVYILASQKSLKLDAGKQVPFKAPDAPFVVATCGFNGGEGWEPESSAQTIWNAQMAVGDPDKHPEFAGNVASVYTRPFYRSPDQSPRNQSFHYHGNAETYMRVGEAMGKAMVDLKNK